MADPKHPHTTDAEAAEQAHIDPDVSDTGGDSDPGASTADDGATDSA
ncbi:MAG: hypothetical protein R2746_15315 [Acidimicrobiales bacterium]|nr:hypothetical protein [Actinomycetota bacterium]